MHDLAAAVPLGIGATLVVDGWALLRRAAFGTPLPDYALVGRWFGYLPRGRLRHSQIASSAPLGGERLLGWAMHYAIGVAFARILLAGWGSAWLAHPTPGPALLVGLATVAAPWLVLQPATGAGIAARHMRRPNAVRLQNLVTHACFGFGLYLSALALQRLPTF